MTQSYFQNIPDLTYEGPNSTNTFAYRHYDPSEVVMGKTMAEHLRLAVCYWHNFVWPGNDPFGGQTFERPWFPPTAWNWPRPKPTPPLTCSAF